MQFKHPELLYALFLLLIPIIIHLFQLRRFEKVPFTNVQFLKKIALQTRKSSKLKKLLILCTRLLLFTAIILAFAQPYFSKITNTAQQHTALYIDNSFSMQMKGESGELMKKAIQDIIETSDASSIIDLYTNDNKWTNLNFQELKNNLLSLEYHPIKKDLEAVLLDINTDLEKQPKSLNTVFLISDFQNALEADSRIEIDTTTRYNFIQLRPAKMANISLDSVYIASKTNETISLRVVAKSYNRTITNVPISLYDENVLLGKSTLDIQENANAEITFKIPFKKTINGRLTTTDDNLNFDNEIFFTLNQADKVNVLAIGNETDYLSKIYTDDEFNFQNVTSNSIDYNSLENQNLIILNELENISEALTRSISISVSKGTHLAIVPSINSNLNSYNSLFKALNIGVINTLNENDLSITDIEFSHPFFTNVFEKSIKNFQYPKVNSYVDANIRNGTAILKFENERAFISQIKKNNSVIYWIASALSATNSNFKNAPLIVPIFYNFGKYSYKYAQLNYTIGKTNEIDIRERLQKDAILTIAGNEISFIPMQQVGNTSVKITTDDIPSKAGIYAIKNKENTLRNIAFNYNRSESNPAYANIKDFFKANSNTNYYNSVKEALTINNESFATTNLWKFFLISGIVFLLIELLLLKFFKP